MEKFLNSGDANLIALLGDANNFIANGTNLLEQYRQKREETKNSIIDMAMAEVEANGGLVNSINEVTQAQENQANVIERANQMLTNREIAMPEINIGTDVVDKTIDEDVSRALRNKDTTQQALIDAVKANISIVG